MAMNGARLGGAIFDALAAAGITTNTPINGLDPRDIWVDVIGPEIIAEIVVNARVASGIPVSTTGTAAAQTGTTTAVGTIS